MAVFQDCQGFQDKENKLITLIPPIISQWCYFKIFKAESLLPN